MKNLNALLPSTRQALESLSHISLLEKFTLVGGSAVAIYLSHRLSEDLDFFSWTENLPTNEIRETLTNNKFAVEFTSINDTQINCLLDGVKVSFFANNWSPLALNEPLLNFIHISPLPLLAAMKVNTIFMGAKKRDYFDLYSMVKSGMSLNEIYAESSAYFKELTPKLFVTALTFIEDIEDENIDYLISGEKRTLLEIQGFFKKELATFSV